LAWLKEDFGKRSVNREKGKDGKRVRSISWMSYFNIISYLISNLLFKVVNFKRPVKNNPFL
jgi:hypothetical protein